MGTSKKTAGQRAVVYMRQSTYREESISLELQESACREYAARQGYEVVAVEADPGISGRTFDRPAVQRTMAMIERGQATTILLWKWSRLSRSRKDWAVAADTVESLGGRIESATEAIDTTTSTGRLARGVMVEFAAFESERIGDVWREAHARRIAHGLPANGKARFGYAYNRETKIHEPDPITGPVLADAYRRYLAGESFYSLVKWLRSTDITPAAGYGRGRGEWSDRTLRRVLDSGFAAGKIRVDGELRDGAHEALISEHEFARYQRRRVERSVRRRAERSQYLLSGMVRCACGATMQAGLHTKTGPRLRCRRSAEYGTHPGGYIQMHYLEDAVRTWLSEHVAALDEHIDTTTPQRRTKTLRDKLEAEQRKIYDALTRLAMQDAEQTISPEVHKRAATQYEDRLRGIESELARERALLAEPIADPKIALHLAADWDLIPIARRRESLGSLIQTIIVTPGRERIIEIHPRTGEPRVFRP